VHIPSRGVLTPVNRLRGIAIGTGKIQPPPHSPQKYHWTGAGRGWGWVKAGARSREGLSKIRFGSLTKYRHTLPEARHVRSNEQLRFLSNQADLAVLGWPLACNQLLGGSVMTLDQQKLASEYLAIEAFDRLLEQADFMFPNDLIGIEARLRRRQEIVITLAAWMSRAKIPDRQTSS
jgi:hypothetical protein